MSPLNEVEQKIRGGAFDEALQALQTASADEKQRLYYTALVSFKRDQYDEAIRLCEELLRQDEGQSRAYALLGQALGLKAQHSGAVKGALLLPKVKKAFTRALELDDANLDALQGLFMFYLFSPGVAGGDESKALELIEKTSRVSGSHARLMQGIYHSKRKEKDQAMEAFGQAAAMCEEDPEVLLRSARFFLEQNEAGKAREATERYVQMNPRSLISFELAADVARQEADWEKAIAQYRQALDVNGHYFPARFKLALCLKENGQAAEARAELEKLQKEHPKSPVRARVDALLKELP